MNMKRIFVVLLTVCLMVNFVFTQALAYEEGLFVSLDGDWRSVTFGPAGVDQGYGYLLANPGQVITVTPKAGSTILKLEVRGSDEDAAEKLTQIGDGYSFVMPDYPVNLLVKTDKHSITVLAGGNGSPVADKSIAKVGEKVTIHPNPASGIAFSHLQIEYRNDGGSQKERGISTYKSPLQLRGFFDALFGRTTGSLALCLPPLFPD